MHKIQLKNGHYNVKTLTCFWSPHIVIKMDTLALIFVEL